MPAFCENKIWRILTEIKESFRKALRGIYEIEMAF